MPCLANRNDLVLLPFFLFQEEPGVLALWWGCFGAILTLGDEGAFFEACTTLLRRLDDRRFKLDFFVGYLETAGEPEALGLVP